MILHRCPRHALHFDRRWGCPLCPDAFDLMSVDAMREADRAWATRTLLYATWTVAVLFAVAWIVGCWR